MGIFERNSMVPAGWSSDDWDAEVAKITGRGESDGQRWRRKNRERAAAENEPPHRTNEEKA